MALKRNDSSVKLFGLASVQQWRKTAAATICFALLDQQNHVAAYMGVITLLAIGGAL